MEFFLIAALGPLLMRVGFAIHSAGMARSKNSAGAVMRQLSDLCMAVLVSWALGFAIVASGYSFFGIEWRSLFGAANLQGTEFVYTVAVLIATGIVPGVLAERGRFWPGLASSALLAGIVIPVAALWVQRGWLDKCGMHDIGGAGWLHLPGALCAAVGAYAVGARTGKFNKDGSSTAIPGHSLPLAGIGVVFLLIGFVLFIGSGGATAAMNVLLAAAAGGMASASFSQMRYYKPDIHLTYAGMVGAMVAISAGADELAGISAVIIGAVAGVIVPLAILLLDVRVRVDDPSGGISIHGVGAVWGLIASPVLARGATVGERLKHLGANLLGIAAIGVLTVALSVGLWMLLKRTTKIRASEADEFDGLDLAEHDIGAYPDFQQTMIKSYHLREV
jgi:Amt family ammonium transporter